MSTAPEPTSTSTPTSNNNNGPTMEEMFPALANNKKNKNNTDNNKNTRQLTAEEAWDLDFA